jgi:hypothetical protein
MQWRLAIDYETGEALDDVLQLLLLNPHILNIRVEGLSDDELKARIHALFPRMKWPRKSSPKPE